MVIALLMTGLVFLYRQMILSQQAHFKERSELWVHRDEAMISLVQQVRLYDHGKLDAGTARLAARYGQPEAPMGTGESPLKAAMKSPEATKLFQAFRAKEEADRAAQAKEAPPRRRPRQTMAPTDMPRQTGEDTPLNYIAKERKEGTGNTPFNDGAGAKERKEDDDGREDH